MANEAAVFFILLSFVHVFSSASQKPATEDTFDITTVTPLETENSSSRVLSRRRRYVVFPRGSSLQCICKQSIQEFTPLTRRFRIGINLGLAWKLPTEAHELYLQKRDVDNTRAALAQEGYGVLHRVDMFRTLELLLSIKGLRGRDCLMRAVCEASEARQNNTSPEQYRGNFMEELHKIVFSLPFHPGHTTDYDIARNQGGNCQRIYSGCISMLDLKI